MNKCGLCEETVHYSSSHCKDCWGYVKRELRIAEWYAGIDSGGNSRRLSPAIRTHLLEQVNYECEECGFDKNHPVDNSSILEIDHIDGNGENHSPTNLKVLCPNCHALTPTYRARNKGKGRKVSYLRVMKNDEGIQQDKSIVEMAKKHNCSTAQLILAWGLQRGYAVIPKSVNKERIIENIGAFNVRLDDEDRLAIGKLDRKMRIATARYAVLPGGYYSYENIWDE